MKQKVWIVGANGAIGFELVKIYLKNGFKVVASSRDIENSKDFLNLKSEYKTNLKLLNIDVLDEQLADYGSRVCIHRKVFLKKLENFGQEKHFEISNQAEKLTIRYDSSVPFQDEETLRPTFIKLLRENPFRQSGEALPRDHPANWK